MLKRNTSKNLTEVTNSQNKKDTFVSYKKVQPGTHEVDELVIKVELLKDSKYKVTAFIGNCYKLQLAHGVKESDARLVILQNKEGDLFLTKHEEGLKLHPTHTWGKVFLTTYSSYIFVVPTELSPNHNNEYRYSLNTEQEQFTAVGEGIIGETFSGWKLTFLESLKPNEEIETNENSTEKNEDEDVDFDDVDMDDIVD